jgi:hypothetical protein
MHLEVRNEEFYSYNVAKAVGERREDLQGEPGNEICQGRFGVTSLGGFDPAEGRRYLKLDEVGFQ